MKIELIKPAPPFRQGDGFDRGERIIMVDGVRWGRTHVSSHGVHGQKHAFSQENGDELYEYDSYDRPQAIVVRSSRSRRWAEGPVTSTMELVHAKVVELIGAGKLRDPEIVKAEYDVQRTARRVEVSKAQARENEAFLQRAKEALFDIRNRPLDDVLRTVVEAMRWAQEQ